MSRSFRDRPIRQKVNVIIIAASAIALVLAAVGVLVYDVTTVRPRAVRDISAQAELIRMNTAAALAFQDRQAATENLAGLRVKREISAAALYSKDGRVFASYLRPPARTLPFGDPRRTVGHWFSGNELQLIEPIDDQGETLGWLALEYSLTPLLSRLPQYSILAGVVLLALLTVSVLLWRLLQSSVSLPLARLADASRAVTRDRDVRVRAVKQADDEIGHLTDAFNEMLTTLEARESALRESTGLLREALTVARMSGWAWNLETNTISWDGQEDRVFGPAGKPRDPSLASFLELIHPSDRPLVEESLWRAARTGQRCEVDFRVLDAEGHTRWLSLSGQGGSRAAQPASRVLGLIMDVTDRRHLEEQLLQSQKLEAIGRLAGGVAHDFNNLLTGILGYARFALTSIPPNHPAHGDIAEIERAGIRAAGLTEQLLSYARRQMIAPKLVQMNDLLANLEGLLRRIIGEDIVLETRCLDDVWPVRIDPGQFEQVILNLAVNARDAMAGGGRLTLETRNYTLDEAYSEHHPEVAPGDYVMLSVADTGQGIDQATQARIFEPFFTTKEQGKGTGLGLAVCYGIVKQAGGHIWVYSEMGRGTTFKVFLPRSDNTGEAAGEAAAPATRAAPAHETILVVEDEPTVRALTIRGLRQHGYQVLEAGDGPTALQVASAHPGELHLLLTDVVMPGMNGKELAERLALSRPGLKVLYMSGYTEHAVVRHGVLEEGIAFISKPFDLGVLAGTIREILDVERVSP